MEKEMSREEAMDKASLLPGDSSSQRAIVSILSGEGSIKRHVYPIPGGKHLTETEDETTLDIAIYNWLRRGGDFEKFEISFAGDYEDINDLSVNGIKPRRRLISDFNWKNIGLPVWKRKGLKEFSKTIAKAFLEAENPLAISLEKEGLYIVLDSAKVFVPTSENWNPVLIVHTIVR